MSRSIAFVTLACAGSVAACGAVDQSTLSTETNAVVSADHLAAVATQTNIVADEEGVAEATDPDLKNAWGLSFNPAGVAWVSAAETGVSPAYDDAGNLRIKVTIPVPEGAEAPAAPTGQVFNPTSGDFLGDRFIFVTEGGTIAGWQSADGTTAVLHVDNSPDEASYKGVALANVNGSARLYAADFHNGKIDVFGADYMPASVAGDLADPSLPAGFAPFNVGVFGSRLIVTYALQDADAADDVAGPSHGFVDVFDLDGHFVQRLISSGVLDSPWGLAMGPTEPDGDTKQLLVGNFGDGRINVFKLAPLHATGPTVARFKGTVGDASGHPLVIDGLWSIVYGPDAGGFDSDEIYFTAGPDDEEHGVFGELEFEEMAE